jgi:NAD-dependent dihydropyrimidine dehydrogenase PreA subunit
MAVRKIVKIDEEKCDGCGNCIISCAEGALKIIDGKARLIKERYCDGLGACLGTCPQDAITIEDREADDFDEKAVQEHLAAAKVPPEASPPACPGAKVLSVLPAAMPSVGGATGLPQDGSLPNWPVQLALVPPDAPFLKEADLVLAADCVPLAIADFHGRLRRGRPVVMACPKLDNREAYVDRLGAIFGHANLQRLTILHMEVPCCGGLNQIVRSALEAAGASVPVDEVTVSIDGRVVAETSWT